MTRYSTRKAARHLVVLSAVACLSLWVVGGTDHRAWAAEPAANATGMRLADSEATALQVEIEALRERYRINEPIRFRVRGNRPFYIYLYDIDTERGTSLLIHPNEIDRNNYYVADQAFVIPSRAAEFYADEEGREQILMVASARELDVQYDTDGTQRPFYRTKAAAIEAMLATKGIQLDRDEFDQQAEGIFVRRIEVTIANDAFPTMTEADYPTALLSTSRSRYAAGQSFDVVFGADRDGWVHLYTIEPHGAYERIARTEVRAGELEALTLRAETPYGWHKLVAVYSLDSRLDQAVEATVLGVEGRNEDPSHAGIAVAVHRVLVQR